MNPFSRHTYHLLITVMAACAMDASAATQFVGDSFEEGTNGMPIAYYKAGLDESGAITNPVWSAAAGDASHIAAADSANLSYAASFRPLAGVTSNWVLNLATEGNTLTRPVTGGPVSFSESSVYVDTLVRFTPCGETPTFTNTQLKAAVFVSAQSNLVVYHSADGLSVTTSVANATIDPDRWYRVTIMLGRHPAFHEPAFKVYLDGTAVTSSAAFDDAGNGPVEGGFWFLTPTQDTSVRAVTLQGSGQVDELAVRDYGDAWLLLTLAFDDALLDIVQDGHALAPNDQVEIGSSVSIDTIDWHELASVTGGCICVSYTGPTGQRVSTSSGQLLSGHAATVFLTAQRYTGSYDTGAGTVDAGKLAAWAIANSKAEADVAAHANEWMDDYLLNVAPGTDAEIAITSITVDEAAGTATITVGASAPDVRLDQLNGTLVVYTCDTLGNDWGHPAGNYHVTLQSATATTVVVDFAAGAFIKAAVSPY